MSRGGVLFQMRDHCRLIRRIETAILEQDASATFYASADNVKNMDIAIRAEAADGHRQSDGWFLARAFHL